MKSTPSTIESGVLLSIFLTASGCANFPPQPPSWRLPTANVTGTVFYRYVQPLPEGAVVRVRLAEKTAEGTVGAIVREQTITSICNGVIDPPCNGPIFYELPFDAENIDPTREYQVMAEILDGEKTIYASNTPNRVLTGGYPRNAQILVARQP